MVEQFYDKTVTIVVGSDAAAGSTPQRALSLATSSAYPYSNGIVQNMTGGADGAARHVHNVALKDGTGRTLSRRSGLTDEERRALRVVLRLHKGG